MSPNNSRAHYHLGIALPDIVSPLCQRVSVVSHASQDDKIKHFRLTTVHEPTYIDGWINWGVATAEKGKFEEALAVCLACYDVAVVITACRSTTRASRC